jgi:hypothetical protein
MGVMIGPGKIKIKVRSEMWIVLSVDVCMVT